MRKIDLSPYCPKSKEQIGGTCYAYAVAYTAYSTQYNIANSIIDTNVIESEAFSTFFVASVVRRDYLRLFKRLFDKNCDWLGTADKSLKVLKIYGCTKISEKDFKCQDGVDETNLLIAEKHKVNDYKTVTENFIFSTEAVKLIVNELQENKPVIAAIYQTSEFYDNINDITTLTDLNPNNLDANHVVCILGYDGSAFENIGAF